MPHTDLLQTLGWTLLHSLWQGALIAALLVLLNLFVKRSDLRYVLACSALTLMLLAPIVTFALLYERPQTVLTTQQSVTLDIGEAQNTTPAPAQDTQTLAQVEPVEQASPVEPVPASTWRQQLTKYLPFMVVCWLAGVVLLSLRLLLQWLYAERFKRRHTRHVSETLQQQVRVLALRLRVSRPVQLLESSLVDAPTVIGFLKPVILLPASALTGLSVRQLESLLVHELAHIRRHDYLVNILQSVIETLLFYHPAVWWVSQRVRIEREHCCDDVAVKVTGNALEYAKALEKLEHLRQQPRLALAANDGKLVNRIRRLVQPVSRSHFPTSWLVSFSTLAVFMVGLGVWIYIQPTQAQTTLSSLQVFDRNGKELTEEIAPHAFGMIRDELVNELGREVLEQNLKVYSTIDLQAQLSANEASRNAEMPPGAQMAVVGVDPSTGGILAMVGEHLQEGQKVGEFNRAVQAYRQPGSSLKPIIYATAFEQAGFTQATGLVDEPTAFKIPGQPDYKPANHDNTFMGSMTLRKALVISRNIPVIKAMEAVTPDAVVTKAQDLGYENMQPYWSLALGSIETTPLQHTAAFGSFANGGVYVEPHIIRRVENAAGELLFEEEPLTKRVWSEQVAYITLDLMHGNVVDTGAFGRRAAIDGRYTAGKTGTTNDERDVWFVGMSPGVVATVWIGYDNNSRLPKKIDPALTRAGDGIVNSSRQPVYIWKDFVEGALRGQSIQEYPVPEGITFKDIDLTTGGPGGTRAAFLAQADESITQPEFDTGDLNTEEAGLEQATKPLQKQIWVSTVGAVAFTDDSLENVYIAPEGTYPDSYILIEEREGDSSKQVKITKSSEGQVKYAYSVNGKEENIDEEVKRWYKEIWSLILNVTKTGSFGEDWKLGWSQSDAINDSSVENLYNAFAYKSDNSVFISYIKDSLSGFPTLLSSVQVSYDNTNWIRLIDEPDFSAYGYIMQAHQVLEHVYFAGGKLGTDLVIKPYVEDLLENVPLTTVDLTTLFPLIEAIKAPEAKKELLLKYLDKVSSMNEVRLEQVANESLKELESSTIAEYANSELESNGDHQHPYLILPPPQAAIELNPDEVVIETNLSNGSRIVPFTFDPKVWEISELLEQPYTLRVTVQDALGERDVLTRQVEAGQSVEASLQIYGEATLNIFVNDLLFSSYNQ